MEAADVVRHFASTPLSEFLDALLGKSTSTSGHCGVDGYDYTERMQYELKRAVTRAVLMLRKCGRADLVAPVYQLKIGELIALRDSAILPLARPPGVILLNHQRNEILGSIKAKANASVSDSDTPRRHHRIEPAEGVTPPAPPSGFVVEER